MTEPSTATASEPPAVTEPAPRPSRRAAIWREIKGYFWVLVAVLAFHSFVAKPFYIPSESMMPVLLKGDRLIVTKYPYGWSFVSPTIPNPAAIVRNLVLRQGPEPWGITLPPIEGRLLGRLPERGDIVIVTPPGSNEDYIKRVVGLPGDRVELKAGRLILNGRAVPSEKRPDAMIPVDANAPCGLDFPGRMIQQGGAFYCRLPIVRETLPGGRKVDTIDLERTLGDDFGPVTVPADHLFLMGDNRDRSADSRFARGFPHMGLGGPVPFENIGGRAEFITFSLDGNRFLSFRGGRAGNSLRRLEE